MNQEHIEKFYILNQRGVSLGSPTPTEYATIKDIVSDMAFDNTSSDNIVFITVRFSPAVKIPKVFTYQKEFTRISGVVYTKTFKRKQEQWKMYSIKDQVDYLSYYFDTVYKSSFNETSNIMKSYELSNDGTVHLHAIVVSHTKYNDYDIRVIRNTVLRHGETMRHLRNGRDYCNNIVICNDSLTDRVKYLLKDYQQSKKYYLPSIERIKI